MRSVRILAFGALLAALLPGVVAAQQTGTRMGTVIPRTKPELVFNKMAECYVARYQRQAARFLDILPGTRQQDVEFSSMNGSLDLCLSQHNFVFEGQELQFEINRFHRGIGYFMVLANRETVPLSAPPAAASDPWFRIKMVPGHGADLAALGVEQFGHCVVKRNWPVARELVLAKDGSKQAKSAMNALQADMNACAAAGTQFKIDKRLVAHVVGDAIYHISVAPRFLINSASE